MSLTERGKQLRRDTIALSGANGGYHYGGCFSCVEILSTLYDDVMTPDDKFIMSKGHSCWPLYVILRERGLNPKLTGHPSRDPHNGIEATTGSLGHGLPLALGMAQARKMQNRSGTVYVLLGDGECQEGTTWESLLLGGKLAPSNLVVIIDQNGLQGSGMVEDIASVDPVFSVAKSVGWDAVAVDGHNTVALLKALRPSSTKPKLVIAHTVKGKGVSFMEGQAKWHANWLGGKDLEKALEELS